MITFAPHYMKKSLQRILCRTGRILLITLAVICTLGCCALFYAGWIMTNNTLAPPDHRGLHPDVGYKRVYARYPELRAWHDSIAARGQWRDTTLINDQGLRLHAIYVPCDGAKATAIVCHGYMDNAPTMMRYTYLYNHEYGMNTLMPEWQYHGASEGDHIQMGWMDRFDAQHFIRMAHAIWPDQPMVMHGVSMGAATVLNTAGEGTPDYVRGYVAGCSFTSFKELFDLSFRHLVRLPGMSPSDTLPAFPYNMAASLVNKLRYGWWHADAAPLKMVPRIEKPVFFIHGTHDPLVPLEMAYRLYNAKTQGDRVLWTPNCTAHAHFIHETYDEYVIRMRAYLAKYVFPDIFPQVPDSLLPPTSEALPPGVILPMPGTFPPAPAAALPGRPKAPVPS